MQLLWSKTVWLFWLMVSSTLLQATETITVYTYHLMPPFVISPQDKTGLYYDFCQLLNERNHRYQFEVQYIPRKRLNIRLNNDQLQGMVIGVNPLWFKDKQEQKYLWTTAILQDRDEVVSNINNPIEYTQPTSLENLRLGGILGFYYHGIDELVKQKRVLRSDTTSGVNNLKKLLHQRIDITIISQYTLAYMVKKQGWEGQFHVSKSPHDQFARRLLIPKYQSALYTFLDQHLAAVINSAEWQQLSRHYRVNSD